MKKKENKLLLYLGHSLYSLEVPSNYFWLEGLRGLVMNKDALQFEKLESGEEFCLRKVDWSHPWSTGGLLETRHVRADVDRLWFFPQWLLEIGLSSQLLHVFSAEDAEGCVARFVNLIWSRGWSCQS